MEHEEKEVLKQALKDQLQGVQPFALDTVRWLFYGPRGGGRTHLICTAALLEVLEGRTVWLVDHSPWSEPMEGYVRTVLFQIATNVGMKIKVSMHRHGALLVELDKTDKEYKWEITPY